jgi:NDP-sugar pyrophosphorylase family protein
MLPVAILAGGLAMRLRPLTATVPKALLPFAGRPFIHWQLELLARQGIAQVVLCVGFLGELIREVVGDGADFGLAVRYCLDGERLLGTGGALKQALPLLGEHFFVLYGDSYLDCSFAAAREAYEASHSSGLMTVFRNENRWDRSNVVWRDGRIVEYNKRAPRAGMAYVDYGLAVLSAQALQEWPEGMAFDLADVYHELSLRGELAGLEVGERFYEIGSTRGIEETERYLSARAGR